MDVLVIGAGVVGLAAARSAARAGHDTIVAEAKNAIGSVTSSRNSEVVHGGMYYPTGSLRARHCVAGRRMLYEYCESHGVEFKKCGKLIVATNAGQIDKLEDIARQGERNGVEGLRLLNRAEAVRLEPALFCISALHSQETGILDAHGYMRALQGDFEDAGGSIALNAPVVRVARAQSQWRAHFADVDGTVLTFDAVINCAGLGAQALAAVCELYPPERIPKLYLAKGNYFAYAKRPVFQRLIYPLPTQGGLGVHVTLDLAGRMRFGPDVEWVKQEDYSVDAGRADAFYASIRRFWPDIDKDSLAPGYSGIRPKLSGPGDREADFMIDGPQAHGASGLIHMFGIESPGLTSALSLAETVVNMLEP